MNDTVHTDMTPEQAEADYMKNLQESHPMVRLQKENARLRDALERIKQVDGADAARGLHYTIASEALSETQQS